MILAVGIPERPPVPLGGDAPPPYPELSPVQMKYAQHTSEQFSIAPEQENMGSPAPPFIQGKRMKLEEIKQR